MPRVTKAMLEAENEHLRRQLEGVITERAHLQTIVGLLKSAYTGPGQTSSLAIAMERMSDALAHILKGLQKHEDWRSR